jgi:hypothetical protein
LRLELETELSRAREALDRGYPEEAVERLGQWPDDPRAELLRAEARGATRRPAVAVPEPTPEALAARRRAMIAVYVVTAVTAVTGLVAAVLIGLTT